VTVIVVPGGRGEVALKARVSGPLCTHVPGTAGDRVGVGLSVFKAVVKWTLTAASRATAVAPGAGAVEATARWTALWAGAVALAEVGFTRERTRAVEAATSRHTTTTIPTMSPVCRDPRLRCRGTSGM
jgi:hypothetical protein